MRIQKWHPRLRVVATAAIYVVLETAGVRAWSDMSAFGRQTLALDVDLSGGRDGAGRRPNQAELPAPAALAAAAWMPTSIPPWGQVVGFELHGLDPDKLLRPGGKAALWALAATAAEFHPEREPLLLVHGIRGRPVEFQRIVDRFRSSRYQLYVLVYDSYHHRTSVSGHELADEIRRLQKEVLGAGRDITIFAHSMGGIVVRCALNELASNAEPSLRRFGQVRFVAVDTPWHGYPGPSDKGASRVLMALVRPLLADGLDEMRARSRLFEGDPGSHDPADRVGLLDVHLPDNVEIAIVSAQDGAKVLDYSKGELTALPQKLVDYYRHETPVRGQPRLLNYWKALLWSQPYSAFQDEMHTLADSGRLDAVAARVALERHFPRFPGDHEGVLRRSGEASLLDHLWTRYGEPSRSLSRWLVPEVGIEPTRGVTLSGF